MSPDQLVGRYRLLRLVGAGGMGSVYEAVDDEIGRRAAIKILHAELAADPQLALRFLNEARAANRIRHPGFVEIYEFGRLPDGNLYIVMEFLDGELLADRFARFPTGAPIEWTLHLAWQLAAALTVAHERGVVHRDLKPDNIMLIPHPEWPGRERVKILDLGIAKLYERVVADAGGEGGRPRTVTGVGVVMGTPQYMAPEQCAGVGDPDGQVDVYALGVILYEGLTGLRPFGGQAALEIMHQHMFAAPVSLRVHRPEVPAALAALVERLLAKPAGERPTMRELAVAV
ncbi:MAG TPA: serine/threonine-protein kinase, partial [Pseudomonadota bacterium]|nr:serine/threonine-protein kinase [Pseudomonadota bacterium]